MNILLVEDNRSLASAIKRCLEPTYSVQLAYSGSEGLYYVQENIFDLVILDIMLPDMSGFEVLQELRKRGQSIPVLILTARSSLEDKVQGFRSGADDYLVKPFAKDELLLRVEAILRRSLCNSTTHHDGPTFKDLKLNPDTRNASINNKVLTLKGRQYDVLEYLVSRQGSLVTKTQIFNRIWGFSSDTSNTVVEVYVSALRKELKAFGYDKYLQTIRGAGYLLSDEVK